MMPNVPLWADSNRILEEIEFFLGNSGLNMQWVEDDRDEHLIRVDLDLLSTTVGPLCWLCCANIVQPNVLNKNFETCKMCSATDAIAAATLGYQRLLPVWFLPNNDVSGTVAEMDQEFQTATQDELSNWFYDPTSAREWSGWLIRVLKESAQFSQFHDVSLSRWQEAVGATRLDAALRYTMLLDFHFPALLEESPLLSDHVALAGLSSGGSR